MSAIELAGVSRWYGNVVAVNDVTMTIGPGVTGLLGPNGAGKSTLINIMSGFVAPSAGTATLDGSRIWQDVSVYRRIGLVPEREALYDGISGWDFVHANARLQRLPDPDAATTRALELVDMVGPAQRRLSTYSKGMKQRVKVATALVHDPAVLLLDEPFNGMDPRQRMHLMQLLHDLAAQGRAVLFSSHILEEVEQLAGTIQVMIAGRLAASGDFRQIRRLMTGRPIRYSVRCSRPRELAAALVGSGLVTGVELAPAPDGVGESVAVQAPDAQTFALALPGLARQYDVLVYELSTQDESLESVFSYLVGGAR